jgi:hypothetical protein
LIADISTGRNFPHVPGKSAGRLAFSLVIRRYRKYTRSDLISFKVTAYLNTGDPTLQGLGQIPAEFDDNAHHQALGLQYYEDAYELWVNELDGFGPANEFLESAYCKFHLSDLNLYDSSYRRPEKRTRRNTFAGTTTKLRKGRAEEANIF